MRSFSRKDFDVQWFSGTGKGGQNRNKHQNCVRITHIETGLRVVGQRQRDRAQNLSDAFRRLAGMLLAQDEQPKCRRFSDEVVRTYHFERNEVIDNSTGIRKPVSSVLDGDIAEFIESIKRDSPRPRSGRA